MSNLRRKISIILLISLILSTIFTPIKVEAATPYKLINLWEKKVTVGGVKFSSKTDADTGKVTIYYKTNNKTRVLASEERLDFNILTNGRWVYYVVAASESSYNIFKKDIKTGKKSKVFSEKSTEMWVSLCGLYKNKLYYVNGIDPGTLCSYDLKSGKKKKVMNNVTRAEQFENVFLCTPYEGDVGPTILRSYDAKHDLRKTITNNNMSYQVISNHLYYVEYVKAYDANLDYMDPVDYICNIVRCDLSGKNKKVLLKNKRINGSVIKITASYIQYMYYDIENDIRKVYKLKYK